MIGLESLGAAGQGLVDIGAVLAEAMVLYVAYGALTTAVSDRLERVVGGE
ncbi:hypothetical protein [Halorientalis sp. IM1011]|nr:hypothetical protein [Halorientalis sp. IM1011]